MPIYLFPLPLAAIDRTALVRRHNVHLNAIDVQAPLTVGNGEFAFTADVTGLQTLNSTYTMPPLQTMSHWGWHTIPSSIAGVEPNEFVEQTVTLNGHTSHYPISDGQPRPLVEYLRANPHRLNLGRLFLRRGAPGASHAILADSVSQINQTLDLWTGTLHSHFTLDRERVDVETVVHPDLDNVAVRICSPLLASGDLGVGLAFPYGDVSFKGGSDWALPATRHTSKRVTPASECDALPVLSHTLDATRYYVSLRLNASGAATCVRLRAEDGIPHSWTLSLSPVASIHSKQSAPTCLEVGAWFTPQRPVAAAPTVGGAIDASARHWPSAWHEGAALELSGSTAPGAAALERRLVLSQFIMMSQEAGSNPPQETGLMLTSWYGKFHLEMRWHHAMHFHLWGRAAHTRRSDAYFDRVRSQARAHTSDKQGFAGVRWPKMVGPPELMTFDDGYTLFTGPSGAGPWLLWQQPHPLSFAEMAYRAHPNAATLAVHNRTVHDTADFMASFVLASPMGTAGCRSLGPPVFTCEIENNEGNPATATSDPTFELVYWQQGFRLAAAWRARQGLPARDGWLRAAATLCAPTPRYYEPAGEEVYYPYTNSTVFAPPTYATQLFAGVLAPVALSNATVLAATLRQANAELHMASELPWCSNFAMYAMVAARLGMRKLAAELLVEPNATQASGGTSYYLVNGHCFNSFLPVYTPANGALLAAAAMLLGGGWDDDDGQPLPGVPRDGTWKVQAEGFMKAL